MELSKRPRSIRGRVFVEKHVADAFLFEFGRIKISLLYIAQHFQIPRCLRRKIIKVQFSVLTWSYGFFCRSSEHNLRQSPYRCLRSRIIAIRKGSCGSEGVWLAEAADEATGCAIVLQPEGQRLSPKTAAIRLNCSQSSSLAPSDGGGTGEVNGGGRGDGVASSTPLMVARMSARSCAYFISIQPFRGELIKDNKRKEIVKSAAQTARKSTCAYWRQNGDARHRVAG